MLPLSWRLRQRVRSLLSGLQRKAHPRHKVAGRPARLAPQVECLEDRLAPANYVVNNNGDAADIDLFDGKATTVFGQNVVTLRSAIQQASQDGGGTITFASPMTITLTGRLPVQSANIRIDGTVGGARGVEIRGRGIIDIGLRVAADSDVRGDHLCQRHVRRQHDPAEHRYRQQLPGRERRRHGRPLSRPGRRHR